MKLFGVFVTIVSCLNCVVLSDEAVIVKDLECSYLLNYNSKHDSSTGCMFTDVKGNTSVLFNILHTYNGLHIDVKAFEILEFRNSSISRVPPTLLDNFNNTEILIMSNCSLGSIRDIDSATKLKQLLASYNQIRHIGEYAFANNKELVELDLSYNQLYTLKPKTFSSNKILKDLNLAGNQFKSVSNAFSKLSALEYLDLSYNQLEIIAATDFNGLVNVNTLNLEGNSIDYVAPNAFRKMLKLNLISLRNNSLYELILNFTKPNIWAADVSMNLLSELEIASSLTKLIASFNRLSELVTSPGVNISELFLEHNYFCDLISLRPIGGLMKLSLAYNRIQFIEYRTFFGFDQLTEVDLSNNGIKYLDMNRLGPLLSLEILMIANNDISLLKLPTHHTTLPRLRQISVSGNPFSCEYLSKLVGAVNQRGWILRRKIVDVNNFDNHVIGIPCYTANAIQECRRVIKKLTLVYNETIKTLQEEVENLNAKIDNLQIENKLKTEKKFERTERAITNTEESEFEEPNPTALDNEEASTKFYEPWEKEYQTLETLLYNISTVNVSQFDENITHFEENSTISYENDTNREEFSLSTSMQIANDSFDSTTEDQHNATLTTQDELEIEVLENFTKIAEPFLETVQIIPDELPNMQKNLTNDRTENQTETENAILHISKGI